VQINFLLSQLCRAVASKVLGFRVETLVDHSFGYLDEENVITWNLKNALTLWDSCRSGHIYKDSTFGGMRRF